MKLKYYMRGLGIGVMVAAVLMGIALGGDKEKLSDAEIMARAKELGMVESSVLADLNKDKEDEVPDVQAGNEVSEGENQNDESVKEPDEETESKQEPESQTQPEPETDPAAEPEQPPQSQTDEEQTGDDTEKTDEAPDEQPGEEPQVQPDTEEYVTLVIERGESSVSVSKSLAELGLVESAKEYDRFLCSNGYDKYIKVGTHKIKVGSTDEEIAEIISRKKK